LTNSKELEQLSSQVHDYKAVLQQLHSRPNTEDAKLISNVLSKVRRNQHPADEIQIDSHAALAPLVSIFTFLP
jgi:hypothetical protein